MGRENERGGGGSQDPQDLVSSSSRVSSLPHTPSVGLGLVGRERTHHRPPCRKALGHRADRGSSSPFAPSLSVQRKDFLRSCCFQNRVRLSSHKVLCRHMSEGLPGLRFSKPLGVLLCCILSASLLLCGRWLMSSVKTHTPSRLAYAVRRRLHGRLRADYLQ